MLHEGVEDTGYVVERHKSLWLKVLHVEDGRGVGHQQVAEVSLQRNSIMTVLIIQHFCIAARLVQRVACISEG